MKTMFSKELVVEAVCECTQLNYPRTISTIWADMLPARLVSAAHYRHQITQTGLMEHSANVRVTELVTHGPVA